MPADSALLSCVPLFERLDADEKSLLAAQLEEETFSAGATIFRKGEPGNSIYIVAAGEVEIYVEDTTGGRIIFETAKTGDFFGELSLLDGDPRSASARAVADTKMLKVDRQDLELLFSRHPAAAMDILGIIGRRLREADKLLGMRPVVSPNQAIDERRTILNRLADFTAAFSGTFTFLMLHGVWFAIWIGLNIGLLPRFETFDPYPFGLLTMVVSLEAIFLSCLVLISQNRQAAKDRIRSDAEYDANIRAGLEVTQLHVKIDQLQEQVLARLAALEKKGLPANGVK
jgi:uncharacterized membrane protein